MRDKPLNVVVPTKLKWPRPRPDTVERHQMIESVLQAPSINLVVMLAPAGYGKTTAMAQLAGRLADQGAGTGWITLDDRDSDITRFLTYFEMAAAHAVDSREGLSRQDADPTPPTDLDSHISRLVNDIANAPEDIALFLDDFDAAASPEIQGFIERLVRYLPAGKRVVLGARALPNIGLRRLQLDGRALVISAEELRFGFMETREFFKSRFDLDDEDIRQLQSRTDGWPAAMQFIALSFSKHADRRAYSRSFSTLTPELTDYLAADVLMRQSGEVRDFLLKTSIFSAMTGALCDFVLERDNSGELLSELNRSGLFVSEDNQDPPWYRYHSLFKQFLEREMYRVHPDLVTSCHLRAAKWLRDNGHHEEAIAHYAAAEDMESVADMIAAHIQQLIFEERLGTAIRWAEMLPEATLSAYPQIQYAAVIAYAFRRQFDKARQILRMLREPVAEDADADRSQHINLEFFLLAAEDEVAELGRIARESLDVIPQDMPFEHGINLNAYAFWLAADNRFDQAHECLIKAQVAHDEAGDLFGRVYQEGIDGTIALAQGNLRLALDRYTEGLRHAERSLPPGSSGGAFIAAHLGEALYEHNELERANTLLQDYLPLIEQNCITDAVVCSFVTIARIDFVAGGFDSARRHLEHLIKLGHKFGLPRMVEDARWELVRLFTVSGELNQAAFMIEEIEKTPPRRPEERALNHHSSDIESKAAAYIRYLIARDESGPARARLRKAMTEAAQAHRKRRLFKLRLLNALALSKAGEETAAKREFSTLLQELAGTGFVRMVVDEGPVARTLLRQVYEDVVEGSPAHIGDGFEGYLRMLLGAFGDTVAEGSRPGVSEFNAPIEALTATERSIVELLAVGKSNKALARQLGVSDNTIKWHLRNVYEKLGVNNRTQAVTAARRFGLVS